MALHVLIEQTRVDNLQRRQEKWNKTNEEAITYIPALYTAGTKALCVRPLALHSTGVYTTAPLGSTI